MRILLHSTYATPDRRANAGETLDIPDDEAAQLIAGGYASTIDDPEPRRRRPEGVADQDLSRGTVDEVIARVAGDPELAAAALAAEQAKRHPRKSLVSALEVVVAGDSTDDAASQPSPPPVVGSGSSRKAWAEYATSIGVEISDEDTKAGIVAKVKAAAEPASE